MKNKISLLIASLIFCGVTLTNAQQGKPVIVSPLVGNELDRVERDYFHFFPRIDGFENAVFYLNEDNSLRVEMTTNSNGVIKDTIIPKYSSLEEIEKHIISRVFMDLRDDPGPNFTIQTGFNRLTEQKMVTLEEEQLFTVDELTVEQEFNEPSLNLIWGTDMNDINCVVKEGESNIWSYARAGTLIGSGVGLIIGFTVGKSKKTENEIISSEGVGMLGGILIGAAVGFVVGAIIGVSSSEEEVIINPNTPEGLSALKSYSLYFRKQKQNN